MNVSEAVQKVKQIYSRTIGSVLPTNYDQKREREKLLSELVGLHLDADFATGEYWNAHLKPRLIALCEKHTSEMRDAAKDPVVNDVKLIGYSHRYDAVMEIIRSIDEAEPRRRDLQSRLEQIEEIVRESVPEPIFVDIE